MGIGAFPPLSHLILLALSQRRTLVVELVVAYHPMLLALCCRWVDASRGTLDGNPVVFMGDGESLAYKLRFPCFRIIHPQLLSVFEIGGYHPLFVDGNEECVFVIAHPSGNDGSVGA